MYLYLIRNTVNQKGYIGITTQVLRHRWQKHYSNANNGAEYALSRAIRKYGKEAFTVELLAEASDWEALLVMECAAIETYNTFAPTGHGYNLTLGGEGALGRVMSEEAKQRISLANMGRLPTPEAREAVGHRHRGVPKSPEQRQKMSEAQLGSKNHNYGKVFSSELRQKLSEMRQGRPISKAQHEAMMAEVTGKPKSESTKQKLREQALERFSNGEHPWIGREHTDATKAKLSAATKAQLARDGNPMQGRTHSEETRRKIAEKARGRAAWNKGLKQGPLSEEHRAKLSEARQGHVGYMTGKTHTDAARAKMSVARLGGKNHNARAILLDGVVYPSIMDAARESGYTHMQVKYRLKTGRATYVDAEE